MFRCDISFENGIAKVIETPFGKYCFGKSRLSVIERMFQFFPWIDKIHVWEIWDNSGIPYRYEK